MGDIYHTKSFRWKESSLGCSAGVRLFDGLYHQGLLTPHLDGLRPSLPDVCPKSFSSLLMECWQSDFRKRPAFEIILPKLRSIKLEGNPVTLEFLQFILFSRRCLSARYWRVYIVNIVSLYINSTLLNQACSWFINIVP